MWKIAAQAVLEHPWLGVGWENVAGAYGDAQERYFASGMASVQEKHVAGAPEYVFNENEATGLDRIVAPEGETIKAIVNGQLIIIRGGVKYNVQGQKL